jgi:hypothetical protein
VEHIVIILCVVKEHAKHVYNDKHLRESLAKYGMVHIPGAIPPDLIRKALYDTNRHLSTFDKKYFAFNDPGINKFSYDILEPVYYDVFDKSFLPHLFHLLLGPMDRPYKADPQVAMRFPGYYCGDEDNKRLWHLDGVGPSTNSNKTEGSKPIPGVHNFDALVVVLLSDSHGKYSGELAGFPQSHIRLSKWLTPERLHEWRYTGIEKLPNREKSDEVVGERSHHFLGKSGDIFLLNYMIAHYVVCNDSPHIRYNMYFRVTGPTFSHYKPSFQERPASLFDPLKNWKI